MGFPRPVSVTGAAYNYLGREQAERAGKTFDVDDLAAAFIRFENGATLMLEEYALLTYFSRPGAIETVGTCPDFCPIVTGPVTFDPTVTPVPACPHS